MLRCYSAAPRKLVLFIFVVVVFVLAYAGSVSAASRDTDLLGTIDRNINVEEKITGALNSVVSFFLYVVVPLVGAGVIAWAGISWAKGRPDGMENFIKAITGVAIAAGAIYIVAWVFNLF